MIHPIIKLAPKSAKATIITSPKKITISPNTNYLSFVFVLLLAIFILCKFFQICNHPMTKVTSVFNISYKNSPSVLPRLHFF